MFNPFFTLIIIAMLIFFLNTHSNMCPVGTKATFTQFLFIVNRCKNVLFYFYPHKHLSYGCSKEYHCHLWGASPGEPARQVN